MRLVSRIATRLAAPAARRRRARQLAAEARALSRRCSSAADLESLADIVLSSTQFSASQKRSEVLRLLAVLRASRPGVLCEIGSAKGGTLALLAHGLPSANRILSIDVRHNATRRRAYPLLARPGQQLTCLQADSHHPGTLEQVNRWLGRDRFDFVLVDGDHTLRGVTADFDMYWPLIAPGGLVALHDIVPDHRTRHGAATDSDTGEVPAFWQALRSRGVDAQELVDDHGQDGYGIGIVRKTDGTAPSLSL